VVVANQASSSLSLCHSRQKKVLCLSAAAAGFNKESTDNGVMSGGPLKKENHERQ